jgi:hypothetical protein
MARLFLWFEQGSWNLAVSLALAALASVFQIEACSAEEACDSLFYDF